MRSFKALVVISGLVLASVWTTRAEAVGWDSDDFIISGGTNFPDRIGVFDHDFTFKGYLDRNFFGVQGMDFDAQGRLIALSSLNPEVRVYDSDGTRAGGFTQAGSPLLVAAGDLKVAPSGNYVLGTNANGARVFTPQGTFVRQYGNGDSRGITFVPGNRLWSGGAGTTVSIFDGDSGAQIGTFTADQQTMSYSMQYSPAANSVLVVDADRDAGGVFERDLSGTLLREFQRPASQIFCYSATRGPSGDVFGTISQGLDLAHWRSDGTLLETRGAFPGSEGVNPVRIVWAGIVPEPSVGATAILSMSYFSAVTYRRNKRMTGRTD